MSPAHIITKPGQLALMIADLRQAGRFALDTESNSLYAYHYQICLIQISTGQQDYLVDPLASLDMGPLGELVAGSELEVTMHAAENDILLLHRDFGFRFSRVFDTLWGARILGWPRPGLAALLEEMFGVRQNKRMQRTDWGRRPLSAAQIEYARQDTHYLLAVRDRQEAELKAQGRWQEAQDVFAELLDITWSEREAPSIWRLPGVWDLEAQQQAVLQAVFDWREERAQRQDVPPFKVLRNETLLALAQTQPRTERELRAMAGIPARLPRHVAGRLLRAIAQGQEAPAPEPPERNHGAGRPDEKVLALYDRLRAWRTALAAQRGVDPDVVMTNQVLMAIARAQPRSLDDLRASNLLGPWKLDAYGPQIVAASNTKGKLNAS